MSYITPSLDNAAYHLPVKLRGYNRALTVLGAVTDADASKMIRKVLPMATKQEHKDLASRHTAEHQRLRAMHVELLEAAHVETFGTKPSFGDYKVCAIGRDEYSEEMKVQLRAAAYGSTSHMKLAAAHAHASRYAH